MGGSVTPPATAQVLPTPATPVNHPVTAPAAKAANAPPQMSANPNNATGTVNSSLNIPAAA